MFPEFDIPREQFVLYRTGYPFREENVNLDYLPDGEVKNYMNQWYTWTQEEFILHFNSPCIIEPDYGWAIAGKHKLIYYSLGVSRTLFQPKPSLFGLLKQKKVVSVSKAVSLRDTGEENYFHFYNDVLSKLYFLEKHSVNVREHSVIISAKLWNKPFFRFYVDHSSYLQSLNWIVQNDEYIHSSSTYFCKPLTHRRDLWAECVDKMIPQSDSSSLRIFLTRDKNRLRFIENMDEIEKVLVQHHILVVDADKLTIQEQITLFSSAGLIAGIHGAGLTNMVYRRADCKVLEVFPPPDLGYLPYHYILLASMKEFPYRAVIGERGRIRYSGGFYLDPKKLSDELAAL